MDLASPMIGPSAADWLVVPSEAETRRTSSRTARVLPPEEHSSALRQLHRGQQELRAQLGELRADFGALARCLTRGGLLTAAQLQHERAVGAGACLEGVLADRQLAARILSAAGQDAWSGSRRASR
mmetsp:Transcript_55257/g.110879  ORF Transcript_55257/g.110879 Transcript_55257/m.110879 type:complete len:126 (-) Transcript_55257:44-421(-)